jgi:hypothetical protein
MLVDLLAFHYCDKMPEANNLKEERFILNYSLKSFRSWPVGVTGVFFVLLCFGVFFILFCFAYNIGVGTQDLHLEPLHFSFFVTAFFSIVPHKLLIYLPRLGSNHDLPGLCLLSK